MGVETTTCTDDRERTFLALRRYYVLSYVAMLVNAGRYLGEIHSGGALTAAFAGAALLTYCAAYLFPFALPAMALARALFWRRLDGALGRPGAGRKAAVYALAAAGITAAQVFIYVDVFIFRLWGYHVNSFVLNVLTTPGGIGSMGTGDSTVVTFAITVCAIAAGQALLLLIAVKPRRLSSLLDPLIRTGRRRIALTAVWALVAGSQAVTFGACKLRWHTPVLEAAHAFPFYVPLTFNKLGRRLGWVSPHVEADMHVRSGALNYPLKPIVRRENAPNANIVWLACESLRADMVDPNIMPSLHRFATSKARWFRRCYSAGDGTRMGVFGMFYGLYGSYWFPALRANRGPVLMGVLREAGYQFDCRTSQSFTYPEFERTVFADVPADDLHPISEGAPGWQRDRQNVANMLRWLDGRDPNRPFFQFMFYESAHSRYFFPPESVIRRPYLEDFNYAELNDISRDPERQQLLKNRYVNACHHLDSQIGAVLQGLEARGLDRTTIVIVTGDHGEEFWEPDRWGHPADSFHDAHELVPLVLYVPGCTPGESDRMVSHLDIPPTVLRLLGVENDPADYSLGHDLLNGRQREYTCIHGWEFMAYIDADCKIVQRYRGPGFSTARVTASDDRPLPREQADRVLSRKLPRLLAVLREMKRFARK